MAKFKEFCCKLLRLLSYSPDLGQSPQNWTNTPTQDMSPSPSYHLRVEDKIPIFLWISIEFSMLLMFRLFFLRLFVWTTSHVGDNLWKDARNEFPSYNYSNVTKLPEEREWIWTNMTFFYIVSLWFLRTSLVVSRIPLPSHQTSLLQVDTTFSQSLTLLLCLSKRWDFFDGWLSVSEVGDHQDNFDFIRRDPEQSLLRFASNDVFSFPGLLLLFILAWLICCTR